jgi:enamine deaminase RidA (YjgF/YER057c/UK114 family)
MNMQRTDVNPWEWSKAFGFSQAVELTGAERVLVCSGQTAVGPDGAPPSTSDMGEQVRAALANLGTVLDAAGMAFTDVVKIAAFTTDVDALFAAWGSVTEAFAPNLPASTAVGVTRLAFPELKVEIEAIAVK